MAGHSAKSKFLAELAQGNRVNSRNEFGLTAKQEAFCQLVSNGQKLSDAYRAAFSATGKPSTTNVSASKLAKMPKVAQRIDELLRRVEADMHRDAIGIRKHVFAGLMAESRKAEKAADRIAALIALGKIDVVGMFRDIHRVEGTEEREASVIEAELREKLASLLEQLMPGGTSNGARH